MGRRRRRQGRPISGILLLDKPLGLSSNQALQRVKKLFDARKAGHTGSLDPLASGLLAICLGEATKVSAFLLDADKDYLVTLRLGERTSTGDAEGEVVEERPLSGVTEAGLRTAMAGFQGEIEQIPPMYSAVKHQGQRLYKLAREGKEVERAWARRGMSESSRPWKRSGTSTWRTSPSSPSGRSPASDRSQPCSAGEGASGTSGSSAWPYFRSITAWAWTCCCT